MRGDSRASCAVGPGGVADRGPAEACKRESPALGRGLRHAPKRTRTSTRESPDKALNLARLPIPPPAQVGEPGHFGRWRGPSIAPSGGAARAQAGTGAAARSGPLAAARTTSAASTPPAPRAAIARAGEAASTTAPAMAAPAATPIAIPVEVQVKA